MIPVETWSVPREWEGERCFVICGGASVKAQIDIIKQLRGRIIAVKQAVAIRPDADVMFVGGKDDPWVCRDYFPLFRGRYMISRSYAPGFPDRMLFLRRLGAHKNHPFKEMHVSHRPDHVSGWDTGSSAINLAYLFGAAEIVVIGMDMTGGRWVRKHHQPVPPASDHVKHKAGLVTMAVDLAAAGVKIWNCSPISTLDCFEKRKLESFL